MRRWRRRETWWRRIRGRLRVAALVCLLLISPATPLLSAGDLPRYSLRRIYGEKPGPRAVIIMLTEASWSDLRGGAMPNLHRLMERGAVGLMPVASRADADPSRTLVTLGAGRAAVGAPGTLGLTALGPGLDEIDIIGIGAANLRAGTGARPGYLGAQLRDAGLTPVVLSDRGARAGGALTLMDDTGRVGGALLGAAPSSPAWALSHAAGAFRQALARYDVVLVDLGSARSGPVSRDEALRRADRFFAEAVRAVGGSEAALWFLSPLAPRYRHSEIRTLAPVMMCHFPASGNGLLTSPSTRWPGLVTASDLAPTVLEWWGIPSGPHGGAIAGRAMRAVRASEVQDRLDHLDRMLTDRYRTRVAAAKWYIAYGLWVALVGASVALGSPAWLRIGGGKVLGLALLPVGLALAAPVAPGHGATYIMVSFLAAGALASLGVALGRSPVRGLALAMLLGAAIIVGDVLAGSPLMRGSALEMGIMMGSRFYGIGNEYMGALVGLTVVGLGALAQTRADRDGVQAPGLQHGQEASFCPTRGRSARLPVVGSRSTLIPLLGGLVVLVIGVPFWGANWGGSFTAATGVVVLWLLLLPRIRARHCLLAALLLAASVALPPLVDLVPPAAARSHIGASVAAALSGEADTVADALSRKAHLVLRVLHAAPWIPLAALIAAAVFWLQLRRGAPTRRLLKGKRALSAGVAAALVAGVVAMVANDSGPAAGFGSILAALSAVVYLGACTPEPAA